MTNQFSQKHYITIAKAFKAMQGNLNKYEIALELAKVFAEDNPKFNFQKFAKAVGITA